LTPAQRLHLTGKLRAILEGTGTLLEDLANGTEPKALLHTADELHNRAAETLAAVVGLARQPGELTFGSGNVAIPAGRTAAEDKASQHCIESGRAAAGITSLLDDTASAGNSDRDHRGAA
jgi:hypothetical protein